MKNQPNKATVKDGLPTADALIEENLGGLELTMDDEMWKFYSDVIRQCMQSYSDQQNAELMSEIEIWKEVSELGKKSIRELIKANEKLVFVESDNAGLRERVKELETRIEETLNILTSQAFNEYKVRNAIEELENALKE